MTTTGATAEGILTPEAVLLDFSEAGLGSRAVAFAIDLIIRIVIVYTVLFAASIIATGGSTTTAVIIAIALFSSVLLGYPVLFETFWNGKTPGKAAMGLRVVTVEGAPVRFRHTTIRAALAVIDLWATVGAFGIASALSTRRSQRLGDLAAGTMVIRERQAGAEAAARTFYPLPGWEDFAVRLDVSRLTTQQYSVIRSFLLRVLELSPDARRAQGSQLAARVATALQVEIDVDRQSEAFLLAVCAAFQWNTNRNTNRGQPMSPTAPAGRGVVPAPVDDGWRQPLAPGWGLAPMEWH